MKWNDAIQYVKGVGPQRAARFAKLGVDTLGRLLEYYPRGYLDYSNPVPIAAAPFDVPAAVQAEVLVTMKSHIISATSASMQIAQSRKALTTIAVTDSLLGQQKNGRIALITS